ncbi:MAG: hypothetical protein V7K48_33445 [Nostoc sp.]
MVGESGTPPKSTLDPEILYWCEDNNLAAKLRELNIDPDTI